MVMKQNKIIKIALFIFSLLLLSSVANKAQQQTTTADIELIGEVKNSAETLLLKSYQLQITK